MNWTRLRNWSVRRSRCLVSDPIYRHESPVQIFRALRSQVHCEGTSKLRCTNAKFNIFKRMYKNETRICLIRHKYMRNDSGHRTKHALQTLREKALRDNVLLPSLQFLDIPIHRSIFPIQILRTFRCQIHCESACKFRCMRRKSHTRNCLIFKKITYANLTRMDGSPASDPSSVSRPCQDDKPPP